jgi:hypothetical protein
MPDGKRALPSGDQALDRAGSQGLDTGGGGRNDGPRRALLTGRITELAAVYRAKLDEVETGAYVRMLEPHDDATLKRVFRYAHRQWPNWMPTAPQLDQYARACQPRHPVVVSDDQLEPPPEPDVPEEWERLAKYFEAHPKGRERETLREMLALMGAGKTEVAQRVTEIVAASYAEQEPLEPPPAGAKLKPYERGMELTEEERELERRLLQK